MCPGYMLSHDFTYNSGTLQNAGSLSCGPPDTWKLHYALLRPKLLKSLGVYRQNQSHALIVAQSLCHQRKVQRVLPVATMKITMF